MKILKSVILFIVIVSSSLVSSSEIQLEFKNLNNMSRLLLPKILDSIDQVITVPDQSFDACSKLNIQCTFKNIIVTPNLSNSNNNYQLEFAKHNKLLYKADLPQANASSTLSIKGKIFGIEYDTQMRVELTGINTFSHEASLLPGFSGSGILGLFIKDNTISAEHIKSPNLKIRQVKLYPSSRAGRVVLNILNKFFEVEYEIKKRLNREVRTYLNSSKFQKIIISGTEELFKNFENIINPAKEYGLLLETTEKDFRSIDYTGQIKGKLKITPLLGEHECTSRLSGYDISVLDSEKTTNEVLLNIDSSFLGDVFYKLAKYPHKRNQKVKKPFLCQKGTDTIDVGLFNLYLNWEMEPINKLSYIFNENENQIILSMDIALKAKSAKKWPKVYLYKKEKRSKIKEATATVKMTYQISHRSDGIYMEMTDRYLENIQGVARIALIGKNFGPFIRLKKKKKMLENLFFEDLMKEYQEIKVTSKEISLFEDLNLVIDEFKLENRKIKINGGLKDI